MINIQGTWKRGGAMPQETASWLDELTIRLNNEIITGTLSHYVMGPNADFTANITEHKYTRPITGIFQNGKYFVSIPQYNNDPFTFEAIIKDEKLVLQFKRPDGTFYEETYRK